jgi:2-isopropylmalate synthase
MSNGPGADRVYILDTTLRDGEQSPGFHLDATSKLRIARQLEKLGVDVIEAGFPASSPGDFEACRRIAREVRGVTVSAFGRALKSDVDAGWAAIKEAESPQIHIVLSASDVHIDRKLGMTRDQVLKRGAEMVSYARSLCDLVEYSPEDAARADPDYLVETIEAMIAAGAGVINIPDSTGYCLPWEFGEIVRRVIAEARGSEKAIFSAHCHNDLGLAVANTLSAITAGARRVECTINGIGERAGNTSLEEIAMLLSVRHAELGLGCGVNTTEITRTSRLVAELTGTPVQSNKAVVGANAFAHSAGIHQDSVVNDRLNYEIMKPEDVGLSESRMVLTARSGRRAFNHRLSHLRLKIPDDKMDAAWQRFLQLADSKSEVSDEDLRKIAATFEASGRETNGNDTNGHPPVTDQLLDHNHVADTLRHLIFG